MAKDVFQEVFIAIVKNFDLLKSLSEEKIKAWICLVTKNKSLNINKKEAHSVPTESGWFEERPGALGELANYIFLVDEINNLPEMYRNVLQWHYIWGFSEKDIAKQLNITPENARHDSKKQALNVSICSPPAYDLKGTNIIKNNNPSTSICICNAIRKQNKTKSPASAVI